MSNLGHAMAAWRRGFHIFPVARNAKIPHRAAGDWGATATNNPEIIMRFWQFEDPEANIGVACKPSQLLVVDLDIAKTDGHLGGTEWAYMHEVYGPRVDGEEVFAEMAYKHGGDSDAYLGTYAVRTRSGGLHLYYRWPPELPRISQASPIKGLIDVRGNGGQWGGYVLGAGSKIDGREYTEYGVPLPVMPAPQWIQELVAEKPQPPRVRRPAGLRQPGAISWAGLVESVSKAGEGNRNNALLWAARAMYSDGAPQDEAQDVLGAAASVAGLGDFEIRQTIASAYRIQQQKEG